MKMMKRYEWPPSSGVPLRLRSLSHCHLVLNAFLNFPRYIIYSQTPSSTRRSGVGIPLPPMQQPESHP